MNINTTFWFFDKISEDNLCLLYNGNFSDDITNKLIELSEYNMTNVEGLSKMKKKASFLMAECFQNIVRHGEIVNSEIHDDVDEGFFLTKNWQSIYYITSGNLIENKNIEDLEKQLQKVNSLSREELKLLYREVLENQELSEKGGAGLGLIEMARKSGQKLSYEFEDFNKDFSFFYNQIVLKSELDGLTVDANFELSEAIALHKQMKKEGILVIHKGDFAQDSIFPVLKIIEENLRKEKKDIASKKKVFHILVELLQNISRHCVQENNKKEGIFLIGKTDNYFVINTGNLIRTEFVEEFKEQLDHINSLNGKELKSLYLEKLRERNLPQNGNTAGIGLIDIARRLISPFNYSFRRIDDKKTFVSLNVVA